MRLSVIWLWIAFLSVCQLASAQTTQPIVNLESRSPKDVKALFYPMPFAVSQWGANPNPPGTLPYVCVGGGLYEATGGLSYWKDGYWGKGGTAQQPAAWDKRWQAHDRNTLQVAVNQYPAGTPYMINVEHWQTDNRRFSDLSVESSIRKFRAMVRDIRDVRPDLRVCVWGVIPANEYYTTNLYGLGMDAWGKYQAGEEALSDEELRLMQGVATRLPTGTWVLSSSATATKAYKAWQDSNTRLSCGVTDAGTKDQAAGLVDAVDYICVPCYDHIAGIESGYYIRYSLLEARRLAGKKKVYAVLCPSYVGGELNGKPIPIEEWEYSLMIAYSLADGVMLWDSVPIKDVYSTSALAARELADR